ncbi:MAG TPA: vWA domain-containing protein [Blastocatellia bacterium]|nr:vWA domain-containing protein [Blastocatellia bacterium]
MAASIEEGSPLTRMLALRDKALTIKLVSARRAVLAVTTTLALMVLAPTRIAQQDCSTALNPECPALGNKIDIAFIIDRSGSMAIDQLGQTYNIEVEGVVRALRDPSVIPRDRSAAVSVWTFSEKPNMVTPLQEIGSAADADAIAAIVEGLKCTAADCNPTGLCPTFGLNPASNYAPVISLSYIHLNQNHRPGARQAMLLSSDGQPTDLPKALIEATTARDSASTSGVQLELDLILLNPTPDARNNADQLVFPTPADDLPGKTLPIATGKANTPCASLSDAAVHMDFERQVREFDTHTRNVIRSFVPKIPALIVNTEVDPDPGTPLNGETLSLRQAIEFANCNGGAATITFANEVNTIRPRVPLPALTAPEITIDGLTGRAAPGSPVTIEPAKPYTTNCDQLDGILVRSNRDVVRGLRIVGFKRAGVGVEPVNLSDNVGFNRIELNKFEMNTQAGVCVLDPPQSEEAAVFHNVGNTISMNDISGSETPIDLALDGPTPNDPGDLDEGPNTLLNFPDTLVVPPTLEVTVTAAGVTLAGSLSGPTVAGATVEIFAITSFRPVSGGRAIDGIVFLKQTTANADGTFMVTGLGDSPTCGYTATVTDIFENTSEAMFPGGGFAKAKVTNLDFTDVAAPNGSPQTGTYTIENTGFAPLLVTFLSVTRDDFPTRRERSNDRSHFIVPEIDGQPVTIQAGQTQTFTAMFNPAIPRVLKSEERVSASQLLPETVKSTINLTPTGCTGSDTKVRLTGHVDKKVRLIDPDNPRNEPPLVTLTRAGNEITARYFIFDSNRDVDTVKYEFQNSDGSITPLDNCCASLTEIQNAYLEGQSFSVTQKFSNARQHKNVSRINVTVCDKEKNCATASGQMGASSQSARIQTRHRESRGKSILSPLRLAPGFAQSPARASNEKAGEGQSAGGAKSKAGASKEKPQ